MDRRIAFVAVLGMLTTISPSGAAVVVVANRTADQIDFVIPQAAGADARYVLPAGAVQSIAVAGPTVVSFDGGGNPRRYRLPPNSIHYFATRGKSLDLFAWPLPTAAGPSWEHPSQIANAPGKTVDATASYTIPVMILADDAEPTVRAVWEKRLRGRLAAASEIFQRNCRVRFEVVAVETWNSDKNARDFDASVAEFERKVHPAPARLAIGFTGRYQYLREEKHVGGIRGPLYSHILIRDALRRASEPERLEVLVHELGHYLGAVHSADKTSVMRPQLGDRQAVARRFQIGFDAPNTLAMCLIGEELRSQSLSSLYQLPVRIKNVLRGTYASLADALPEDPAAPKYQMLLDVPVAYPPRDKPR